MDIPTDVDTEKKIAVIFGQMCAAFAAGAGQLGPSNDVFHEAFKRYHDGIAITLQTGNPIPKNIPDLARRMGRQAAVNADDDADNNTNMIGKTHFIAAAEKIEKQALDSKVCERIKFKDRTCAICDVR
jgi:hypothetical protein